MADDDDGEPIEGLSFWEPGGYKKTTKRITDGNQLCTDIVDMVKERCDIEETHAKALKNWSKRWGTQIDKGMNGMGAVGITETEWPLNLIHLAKSQSINQSINDPLKQPIKQPINQSINQLANCSKCASINQSIDDQTT